MSAPYYVDESVTLWLGDCLDVLRTLPDASVDSVCTDPPYGLEFMGKEWDKFGPQRDPRVAGRDGAGAQTNGVGFGDGSFKDFKVPAFGISKPSTLKCDTCGVRSPIDKRHAHPDCGGTWIKTPMYEGAPRQILAFQAWCEDWATECLRVLKPGGHLIAFGGTRTSHRLACAVEDAGFEIRDSIAWLYGSGFPKSLNVERSIDTFLCVLPGRHRWTPQACTLPGDHVCPSTTEGRAHAGDGTALKPSFEPIVVGRKPLIGTVAANVLAHGTGALNVDACRVGGPPPSVPQPTFSRNMTAGFGASEGRNGDMSAAAGRWPTNVILDDSQAAELDRQTGVLTSGSRSAGTYGLMGYMGAAAAPMPAVDGDSGGASRFFPTFHYEAKAPALERPRHGETAHPTVKPVDLMRWLVRLVTPPGGLVLDPFAGSGTTAEACVVEGFRCVLIEREPDYLPLIVQRLTKPIAPVLDFGASA